MFYLSDQDHGLIKHFDQTLLCCTKLNLSRQTFGVCAINSTLNFSSVSTGKM
uniref:Uncharacterized protein n=1 Tax=Anguilla anguilla TaxID=7936 RepID=A0A0E9XJX6_ANGAN